MDYEWQDDHQISETSELYREKVYSRLRQKIGRKNVGRRCHAFHDMGLLMSTTLEAAVHLGTD